MSFLGRIRDALRGIIDYFRRPPRPEPGPERPPRPPRPPEGGPPPAPPIEPSGDELQPRQWDGNPQVLFGGSRRRFYYEWEELYRDMVGNVLGSSKGKEYWYATDAVVGEGGSYAPGDPPYRAVTDEDGVFMWIADR